MFILVKSVISVFIDLYNKGLIYRGYRMVNWDPKAKTTLSDEEVNYIEEDSSLYYLRYTIEDSNIDLENIYKFSAVWGAHEGSILLWVLVMSIWCSLIILLSKNMPKTIIIDMISVMGLLLLFFLVFICL